MKQSKISEKSVFHRLKWVWSLRKLIPWIVDIFYRGHSGAYNTTDAFILIYESISCGNLAVCIGCILFGIVGYLHLCTIFTIRMAQSTSMRRWQRNNWKPIYDSKQFLVFNWHINAAGLRFESEGGCTYKQFGYSMTGRPKSTLTITIWFSQ